MVSQNLLFKQTESTLNYFSYEIFFVAAEVLSMCHPFVKVKPLAQATAESRNKAKKSSASLQPYRQRPETCAALARRLGKLKRKFARNVILRFTFIFFIVTGALGVRLKTAKEERENERRVLSEARGNLNIRFFSCKNFIVHH